MALIGADIIDDGAALAVHWSDGTTARFHAIWLRDNARDPETRDPGNGQRLISLADIPADLRIEHASVEGGDLVLKVGGHQTIFPSSWLRQHVYDRPSSATAFHPDVETWGGDHTVKRAELPQLQADNAALCDWLAAVQQFGVAIVESLPTESGGLQQIVDLFGHIRETNYGRWFEVRSEVNPTNLAYTNLGLQAHTDNPYRDPVPGLQILACLENTVEGGESSVVDGFRALEMLRSESAAFFDVLCAYPVQFEYAGSAGVRLRARRPIVECNPDGQVMTLRFNNRSIAAPVDVPFDEMQTWYAALRRLGEIIDDPANAVTFRLEPGQAFIVDNTRVLHARSAFSSGGSRWLQGCYADRDGLLSTLAALEGV